MGCSFLLFLAPAKGSNPLGHFSLINLTLQAKTHPKLISSKKFAVYFQYEGYNLGFYLKLHSISFWSILILWSIKCFIIFYLELNINDQQVDIQQVLDHIPLSHFNLSLLFSITTSLSISLSLSLSLSLSRSLSPSL